MNTEARLIEKPSPNYETIQAIQDVENKIGESAKNSDDLFNKLDI